MKKKLESWLGIVLLASSLSTLPVLANTLRLPDLPEQDAFQVPQNKRPPKVAPTQAAEQPQTPEPEQSPEQAQSPEAPQTPEQAQVPEKAQEPQEEELFTTSLGEQREDLQGTTALLLPEKSDKLDFLEGDWNFTRYFIDKNGKKIATHFSFDANGQGEARFINEDGEVFTSPAKASMSNGKLNIETGKFFNKDHTKSYAPETIQCQNLNGIATCQGTDGHFAWRGEEITGKPAHPQAVPQQNAIPQQNATPQQAASPQQAEALPQQAETPQQPKTPEQPKNRQQPKAPLQAETPQQPVVEQPNPAQEAAEAFAQIDPGPEMAPVIMEQAKKAQAGSLSALAGDWRYSRDLSRKSDGQSVALEFHFDKNGKGRSVIKDGSGKEFSAPAEAMAMPDGSIRVKTDKYTNGQGQGYYPSMMTCKGKRNKDLFCDVNNGWTHIENGRLLSLNDLEKKEQALQIEELLPSAQSTPRQEAEQPKENIEDLLAGLSTPAEPKQEARPAAPIVAPGQKMVLPKKDDKMSFLQGKWRCNTGLVRTSDGQPIVMEFSFGKNGNGNALIRERSGKVYSASAQATYRDGILRINTSRFISNRGGGSYQRHFLQCADQGGAALCSGRNGNVLWNNATFTRLR